MNHPVKQTKLDQMVEDIKALGLDKNPVYYNNTGFTDECSLYTLSPAKPLGECAEAIGTIKDFWLPELFSSAPELALEVKRLREQNKLMVNYFRYMRDGGFTDADWRTVNEWIGEEE